MSTYTSTTTADLQAIRGTIHLGETKKLVSKGIEFGELTLGRNGLWDTSKVQGLGRLSLLSTDSHNPPTLVLRHAKGNCYRVLAQDDTGKTSPARGAALHVGNRVVRTRAGSACVGRHLGMVSATLRGAVRSNALS